MIGIGAYRPRTIVCNDDLVRGTTYTDDWVRRRTGVVRRGHAAADETITEMASRAGSRAMAAAGISADAVDMVLVASMSDLRQTPAAAPEIAFRLGARRAAALDIDAACAGFSYGVGMADALVRAGTVRHVLLIGVDRMTDMVSREGSAALLFADGAGAMVIGPGDTMGIGPTVWGADGARRELIAHGASWRDYRDRPEQPWPTMQMAGREVFRWAIDTVPELGRRAVEAAGLEMAQVRAFVPHQANLRIIERAAERLGLSAGTPVADDIINAGNTSAASIPLALEQLRQAGRAHRGDWALLVGFGAGLAYAAQVVQVP
ncbi:beta-ketoacyl-ACP synthase 3 [Micromonospora harpali]|uniref:Beta-ketoacyl-ACP synthase 3 n=1 Tax=Micromonospora harpali TaxID=1490225 RepID=A0ABW1HRA6_9ACTN